MVADVMAAMKSDACSFLRQSIAKDCGCPGGHAPHGNKQGILTSIMAQEIT